MIEPRAKQITCSPLSRRSLGPGYPTSVHAVIAYARHDLLESFFRQLIRRPRWQDQMDQFARVLDHLDHFALAAAPPPEPRRTRVDPRRLPLQSLRGPQRSSNT